MIACEDFELDFELAPEDMNFVDQPVQPIQPIQSIQQMQNGSYVGIDATLATKQHEIEMQRLKADVESLKRDKQTKEGEVSLLRQKLDYLEREKFDISARHTAKLESLEQERRTLHSYWQNEMERLKTEIKFQEAEEKTRDATQFTDKDLPFSKAFGDLLSNKRPRTRPATKETSCEATEPEGSLSADNPANSSQTASLGNLFTALGFADVTFSTLHSLSNPILVSYEVHKAYRSEIHSVREAIEESAHKTNDPLLAVRSEYLRAVSERRVLSYIEYLVCFNRGVGSIIRNKISLDVMSLEKSAEPDSVCNNNGSLLQELCLFFASIPDGKCLIMVHQHFRILKHILYCPDGLTCVPNCVIQLFEDGTILRKLHAFQPYRLEIISDVWDLIQICAKEKRVSLALMAQDSNNIGCSLLNLLNEILLKRIYDKPYHLPLDEFERFLIFMHFDLVRERVLPASIAFEPLTVRIICRRLALVLLNDEKVDVESTMADVTAFMQILYQILVSERAPPVHLLCREFVLTLFVVRALSTQKPFEAYVGAFARSILPKLEDEIEKIRAGEYLPVPMVDTPRREKPLTEEEENAMYKAWKDGSA